MLEKSTGIRGWECGSKRKRKVAILNKVIRICFMDRRPTQRLERCEKTKNIDSLTMGERKRKGNHSPIFMLCCGYLWMSSTIWRAASCWEGSTRAGLQLVLSRYKVWICFPTLRVGSFSMDGVYRKSPGRGIRGGAESETKVEDKALPAPTTDGHLLTGLYREKHHGVWHWTNIV